MKDADPSSFWYKIPDTKGLGGKRPFDGFLVCGGKAFAIEFKINGGETTRFQDWSLEKFRIAGGITLVFNYPQMSMDKMIKRIIRLGHHE